METTKLLADDNVKSAFGLQGEFRPLSKPADRVQRFQQMGRAGDSKLPLFDHSLTVYFGERGTIEAVAANVVRQETVVEMPNGLTPEAIVERVAEELSLPAESIKHPIKGIYVVPGNAAGERPARVAYKVQVGMGEYRRPLDVLVDAEDARILEIR